MKIAIVANPYVPVPPVKYGGTERIIYFLIKGLKEMGHEPILIGPGDSKVDCETIPSVEKAIYFPRRKSERAEYKKIERDAIANTKQIIRGLSDNVDIVHSHDLDMLGLKRTLPNVTTLHGPILLNTIPYFMKRSRLNYICISQNQKLALSSLNAVGIAYNGLDPSEFPVVKEPEDYVAFIGRFDREKNPHLAIELALSLEIPIKVAGKIDFQGDGYFEEEVEKYFDDPLVEYLGEIGFDEKVELLSNAKCNLHPTGFREPFGLTVLEAAYCGTPTIAIAKGSMPELIEDGRTGLLVEDFVEGYEGLKQCFEMDREYIAQRSRLLFNYHKMTDDYVRLYKKAIKMHSNKRTSLAERLPKAPRLTKAKK